ncbi:heavy metal-associated domain-containing protein [Agromyces sp. G08B096]|uniref:Heavy metal-associated domain-containing protein n=1 Tax=Agromyces sp. G08B096 TaxID=3156399 RepID=A0AAU7W9S1_9MICO
MTTTPADARLLPLADEAADASCSCCAVPATTSASADEQAAATDAIVAEYAVAGMTCGNCVAHVTSDLSALEGVRAVEVDLVAGGVSTVRVTSDVALETDVVAEAVADAGYQVVQR